MIQLAAAVDHCSREHAGTAYGCRFGQVDKISSWLGRLPGTMGGTTYISVCVDFV